MKRFSAPELLDELPVSDPLAVGSRKDLRKLNRLMGHPHFFLKRLRDLYFLKPPRNLVEIGVGDGSLMLFLAQKLRWRNVEVWLIDRQKTISPAVVEQFEELGWKCNVLTV